MSPEHTVALQSSFAHIAHIGRIGPYFAATFYRELFAIAPGLHVLFGNDMIQQGKHLIDALGRIVDGVNAPESVLPIARALALRHVGYGVEARHYIAFATALMRTLRHELAQEFTPSARDAWVSAIELLSQTMMDAAYGADAPQVPNAALRVG